MKLFDNIYCKCGCGVITPIAKRNRYELGHIKGKHVPYVSSHNKNRGKKGVDHYNHKGDKASYSAYHLRVQAARGVANQCKSNTCNKKSTYYEWANLTGKYEDINDYKSLCRSCHTFYDNSRKGGDVTA